MGIADDGLEADSSTLAPPSTHSSHSLVVKDNFDSQSFMPPEEEKERFAVEVQATSVQEPRQPRNSKLATSDSKCSAESDELAKNDSFHDRFQREQILLGPAADKLAKLKSKEVIQNEEEICVKTATFKEGVTSRKGAQTLTGTLNIVTPPYNGASPTTVNSRSINSSNNISVTTAATQSSYAASDESLEFAERVTPPSGFNHQTIRAVQDVQPGAVSVGGFGTTNGDNREIARSDAPTTLRDEESSSSTPFVLSAELVDESAELKSRRRVDELEAQIQRLREGESQNDRVRELEQQVEQLQQVEAVRASSVLPLPPLSEENSPSANRKRKIVTCGLLCVGLLLAAIATVAILSALSSSSSSGVSDFQTEDGVPTQEPTLFPTILPTSSPTLPNTQAPLSTASFTPPPACGWGLCNFRSSPAPSVVGTQQPVPTASFTAPPACVWGLCNYRSSPEPSLAPTKRPTAVPTADPTTTPTIAPMALGTPIAAPTSYPTLAPTPLSPTATPTALPTLDPTALPTLEPTLLPTLEPTLLPTRLPTASPTGSPTLAPTPPIAVRPVESQQDLFRAVDAFLDDDGPRTLVARTYGWPIGLWQIGSGIQDLSDLFSAERNPNAAFFNSDISGWDTSRVVSMNSMFLGATMFNGNLSPWVTTSVRDMGHMFSGSSDFQGFGLANWETGQVTNMRNMFDGAVSFSENIVEWNVQSVLQASFMFHGASSFNHDLCLWNEILPPTVAVQEMFSESGCPFQQTPTLAALGPLCFDCGGDETDDGAQTDDGGDTIIPDKGVDGPDKGSGITFGEEDEEPPPDEEEEEPPPDEEEEEPPPDEEEEDLFSTEDDFER